ncbi:bifunctional adenosylcobinamide kinase/adenosylcobinamide-phosphate guanylyltransferase [Pseudobacteriovorax antillogorgiicola]|uniref:Adenosylcobinamide kinase n=1 Tax=Pseudobacteriovorax antillogorgiicola TaxID=1513793 RepID=A0A1Y6B693_9BACT|nr:bifunctional adenosylcobinamide kinase/adenosylcobinamide-phosphate guanylyltransferase [Pseudobacteriovorax antillogorgiicola]TCS58817.1 adenosylcobinamide kinase /adenosylcobinamide-phosphate guanylyltransferase [Pseudobacteriovorax antillogorgiicola]SME94328.1 adenosylcobinamide kinase /adenosylcobinamide-phosphate guanylyltransferase [Pseudobacteriovorax antillogorgiicola]
MLQVPRPSGKNLPDLQVLESPILIIGAAFTGKSELANRALDTDKIALVIGTGSLEDNHFQKRIQDLKDQRPPHWEHVEPKQDALDHLESAQHGYDQILFDSVNQWIAELTLSRAGKLSAEQLEDSLLHEGRQLCKVVRGFGPRKRLVLVTSEVGAGITPPSAPARAFRQATSRINCYLAEECRSVVMVSAGLPLVLKGQGFN